MESALAGALVAATKERRWDLVAQLAAELQARREARERDTGRAEVVAIQSSRGKREAGP